MDLIYKQMLDALKQAEDAITFELGGEPCGLSDALVAVREAIKAASNPAVVSWYKNCKQSREKIEDLRKTALVAFRKNVGVGMTSPQSKGLDKS